jgi:hypothetical protein
MSDLDELPRRLDGLQDDLTGMRLRPADGVRRRAAQRSRRQTLVATAGTLAVAGVLGVAALQALPGADRSEPLPPAASTTPNVVVSPSATASPTATSSPLLEAATALLPASALPRTLPQIDTTWMPPERTTDGSYWAQETSHVMSARDCWSRPVPQPRQEIVGTYGSDYMADAVEVVAVAADEQAAADAFAQLRQRCLAAASPAGATMPSAGGLLTRVTDLTGADQGFELTEDAEENGEVGAHLLTVLRRGDRIVMLLFRDVSAVSDLNLPELRQAAVRAADRVTS